MELFDAIHGRFTNKNVTQASVPREAIEKILSAAVQAPNHYKVRPWRFVVLTGQGRDKLGEVMAASFLARNPATPPEGLDKTRALPLRAPLVIAVGVDKPTEPKVLEIENISAVSAACMNILLAARALGLAAKWSTGEWARDLQVKQFLGFAPDQIIVAFIYIGYPEILPAPYQRQGFEDRVVWMQ